MANDFDKILKENLEDLFPALARNLFGIELSKSEEIPDDVQITIERKPDFLKRVVESGSHAEMILQIEFQSLNDREMKYRMMEYQAILMRKYQMPVSQYVVYLGKSKMKMENEIISKNLIFRFELVDIKTIPYSLFVSSDSPEEVILAILCNFMEHKPDEVIDEVLHKLTELNLGKIRLLKCVKQLQVLARLRNLQPITVKKIQSMPIEYDVKSDYLYKEGRQEGITEAREKVVTRMLLRSAMTVDQIADLTDTKVSDVKSIQSKLIKSGKLKS